MYVGEGTLHPPHAATFLQGAQSQLVLVYLSVGSDAN